MRIPLHKLLLLIHDIFILGTAIILSSFVYSNYSSFFQFGQLSSDLIWGYVLTFVSVLIAMNEYDLYKYEVILDRTRHFTNLQKALFVSLVALVFCSFIFKFAELSSSRILLGLIYLNTALLFCITRVMLVPNIFFTLVRKKVIDRNLLIVGSGKLSADHTEQIIDHNSYFNIVGIVQDDEFLLGDSVNGIPVLGTVDQLDSITTAHNIHDILVASDCKSDDRLHEIIENCKKSNRTVHIVSELYNIATQKIGIEEIGKVSSFRYIPPQPGGRFIYPIIKKIIDVVLALVVIIGFLPIWLFIAGLIKSHLLDLYFIKQKL